MSIKQRDNKKRGGRREEEEETMKYTEPFIRA
jgi:hypothetical protein